MKREDAFKIINDKGAGENLVKHMLAAEACMAKLAGVSGGDPEEWGLAGLLHDLDYQETKEDPARHGLVSSEILSESGVSREITGAILAHSGKKKAESDIEKALYSVDPATGLIAAAALMHPEKKLSAVDTAFLMKRFREKRFAAGASREQIASCTELGLELEEFLGICLEAMQGVSSALGL